MRCSLLLICGLLLCLVSCAPTKPDEELVFERAAARWALMRDGKYEGAWKYYTPGFRESTSREAFVRDASGRQTEIVDATVVSVTCESPETARCDVTIELAYRVQAGPRSLRGVENRRIIRERWIYIDKNWWYTSS